MPGDTVFVSADPPPLGADVWFSAALPPELPGSLQEPFDSSSDAIRDTFQKGVLELDGTVSSPFGAATTFVAFELGDPARQPPALPTDTFGRVSFRVQVDGALSSGALISNDALIQSDELLASLSPPAVVVVSGNPSLRVDRSCTEVGAREESITWVVDYYNDTSNDDDDVVLIELIPPELELISAVHTFNAATGGRFDQVSVTGEPVEGGLRFAVTDATGEPLVTLEGGRIVFTAVVRDDVPTGTVLDLEGLASADNGNVSQPVSVFTGCSMLVANPDLNLRKLVDLADPLPDENVTFTLLISNQSVHAADDVVLSDVLPVGLEYVPGSTFVLTSGWSIPEPVQNGQTLTWSQDTGNALVGPSQVPGWKTRVATRIFGSRRRSSRERARP